MSRPTSQRPAPAQWRLGSRRLPLSFPRPPFRRLRIETRFPPACEAGDPRCPFLPTEVGGMDPTCIHSLSLLSLRDRLEVFHRHSPGMEGNESLRHVKSWQEPKSPGALGVGSRTDHVAGRPPIGRQTALCGSASNCREARTASEAPPPSPGSGAPRDGRREWGRRERGRGAVVE